MAVLDWRFPAISPWRVTAPFYVADFWTEPRHRAGYGDHLELASGRVGRARCAAGNGPAGRASGSAVQAQEWGLISARSARMQTSMPKRPNAVAMLKTLIP